MSIESLPAVSDLDDLSSSDAYAADVAQLGGDARVPATLLAQHLLALAGVPLPMEAQRTSPQATGFTATVEPSSEGRSVWLLLTPAAAYAAGTIALPAGVFGQEVFCTTTQAITAVVLTSPSGAIYSPPSGLAAGGRFAMRSDGTDWYRVS